MRVYGHSPDSPPKFPSPISHGVVALTEIAGCTDCGGNCRQWMLKSHPSFCFKLSFSVQPYPSSERAELSGLVGWFTLRVVQFAVDVRRRKQKEEGWLSAGIGD